MPEDAPHGSGPGFAGEPPQRPHGKLADPGAGEIGEAAEQAEASARARREERRDQAAPTGEPRPASEPLSPPQVGQGRQALDDKAPSAFEPTRDEAEDKAKKPGEGRGD